VGNAARVAGQLRALADALALDEIVVNTWTCDPAVRRRSYELLAREFGLSGR
jgi:alkanesulfonate monooxygenase SsuD/methylene tetrahydromethanopterin reductase-like flavin-dependent oxidoreductase (luciferase family)